MLSKFRYHMSTLNILSQCPPHYMQFQLDELSNVSPDESSGRTNSKKFQVLLETVNAKSRLKSDVKHKKNYCSWYGQCYEAGPVSYNCAYNKKAKDLEDEEGLNILKEYCPSIYGDGTDVRTCCDTKQLQNMKENMQVPYSVGLKSDALVKILQKTNLLAYKY